MFKKIISTIAKMSTRRKSSIVQTRLENNAISLPAEMVEALERVVDKSIDCGERCEFFVLSNEERARRFLVLENWKSYKLGSVDPKSGVVENGEVVFGDVTFGTQFERIFDDGVDPSIVLSLDTDVSEDVRAQPPSTEDRDLHFKSEPTFDPAKPFAVAIRGQSWSTREKAQDSFGLVLYVPGQSEFSSIITKVC